MTRKTRFSAVFWAKMAVLALGMGFWLLVLAWFYYLWWSMSP